MRALALALFPFTDAMRATMPHAVGTRRASSLLPPRAALLALDDATADAIANGLTLAPLVVPIWISAAVLSSGARKAERAELEKALRDARAAAQELDELKSKVKLEAEAKAKASMLESKVGTLNMQLELLQTEARRAKERQRQAEEKAKAELQRLASERVLVEQRLSRAVLPEPPNLPHRLAGAAELASGLTSPEAALVRRLGKGLDAKPRPLQPGLRTDELILVLGAPEPMAVLVVGSLLERAPAALVRATVPPPDGADAWGAGATEALRSLRALAARNKRLQLVECDLLSAESVRGAMADVGAVICCASTGGSFPQRASSSPLEQLIARLTTATSPRTYAEDECVRLAAEAFAREVSVAPQLVRAMTPKFVLLSAAGVTRSLWSREKQRALPALPVDNSPLATPIRRGEEAVRESGLPYAIVRACQVSEGAPRGRAVFSSGDLATGSIARQDAADALPSLLTLQTVRRCCLYSPRARVLLSPRALPLIPCMPTRAVLCRPLLRRRGKRSRCRACQGSPRCNPSK